MKTVSHCHSTVTQLSPQHVTVDWPYAATTYVEKQSTVTLSPNNSFSMMLLKEGFRRNTPNVVTV
jgi:hypothetical protein